MVDIFFGDKKFNREGCTAMRPSNTGLATFLGQIRPASTGRDLELSNYYTWFLKWNRPNIKDNLKGWITTYRENEFILALFPLCSVSLKKTLFSQESK